MEKDLISVIIPAYNIAPYLPRCLESLQMQTYPHLELIVVDDGSTDNTPEVLAACAQEDSRIRVIRKENGGVTRARLRGAAEASGAWIGFVDGDDICDPDMFLRLQENGTAQQADISHCGYKMIYPDGRVDYYYNTGRTVVQDHVQGCLDLLNADFVEPGLCNKLFRRELFDGLAEWMDNSIRINEDLLMNFYLFRKANRSVYEDFCPYHYLLRKGSATKSLLNIHKLRDPLEVQRKMLAESAEVPQWQDAATRRLAYQLIKAATMDTAGQAELVKPFRREARQELRRRLWGFLTGSACGWKLKVMALWGAVWPWSYGFVHRVYARVTGIDKKYDI